MAVSDLDMGKDKRYSQKTMNSCEKRNPNSFLFGSVNGCYPKRSDCKYNKNSDNSTGAGSILHIYFLLRAKEY